MELQLSDDERAVLVDLLRDDLGSLRAEIYRTEAHEFKDVLKDREALLTAILERLTAGSGTGAG
jgi:hypothetical protein